MVYFDLIVIILSFVQPLIIGFFFFLGIGNYFSTNGFYFYNSGIRQKITTTKFYECATYSRKNNIFVYTINSISILFSFIVYDIDLLFFLSEVMVIVDYSFYDFFVLFFFFVLFILGLSFESKVFGFIYKYR